MSIQKKIDLETYSSTKKVLLKPGETVWAIAKRTLQEAKVAHDDQTLSKLTQVILELNNISHEEALSIPSQYLKLPIYGGSHKKHKESKDSSTPEFTDTYTVQKGDNLTTIAEAFANETDLSQAKLVKKLYKVNKKVIGKDKNLLHVGQKLWVPTKRLHMLYTIAEDSSILSLGKLISHYYKDWLTVGRKSLAKQIRKHPNNEHLKLPKDIDEVLPIGTEIYLPDVSPAEGQTVDLPYNFYRPETLLARIPSLTHAIASTLSQFLGATSEISMLSIAELEQLLAEIVGSNPGEAKSNKPSSQADCLKQIIETLNRNQIPVDPLPHALMGVDESNQSGTTDTEFELKQLLNLYVLACNLYHFVLDGLPVQIAASSPPHWHAKQYRKYPPINLMREALRRASIDLEIVQRALVQRRRPHARGVLSQQTHTLMIMDKLAFKALAPFQHMLLDDSHTRQSINPITYFSEHTHIRQIPHTHNVILVGMAYAQISQNESHVNQYLPLLLDLSGGLDAVFSVDPSEEPDIKAAVWPAYELMAIPHEVGHFVYHHGKIGKTEVTVADWTADLVNKKAKKHPYHHWYEELFADVYGCIVAGPLAAMGMQTLLAAESQSGLSHDDGEHPAAMFRPFIYSEILRQLTKSKHKNLEPHKFKATANKLDENWWKLLQLRGFVSADLQKNSFSETYFAIDSHTGNGSKTMSVSDILDAVRPIINEYIGLLAKNIILEPRSKTAIEEDTETLTAAIPWCKTDVDNLNLLDDEMRTLSSLAFAHKKLPSHIINPAELSPMHDKGLEDVDLDPDHAEQLLLEYLANWGDSGPGSWGNHP
ncbi:MAG: hypothetical protein ACI9EW_000604 [Cellvibrionaceae bacterium]|jgi:hypothetical protein